MKTTERHGKPLRPTFHQRILVPLDGSELAEQVLPYVAELVRPGQTRIHLLSVLTVGVSERTVALVSSCPPGLHLPVTISYGRARLEVYLREVAASLRECGARVQHTVREGHPAEEILIHAQEIGADLIVMNIHGLSGVSRWVFGSVADRVLRSAPCPVLLMRAQREEEGRDEA